MHYFIEMECIELKKMIFYAYHGHLDGNIECSGKVIIGPHAEINGNIQCQNTDLMGVINGNIIIYEVASLKASVKFTGEIAAKYIEIEPGASFNGTCKMQ